MRLLLYDKRSSLLTAVTNHQVKGGFIWRVVPGGEFQMNYGFVCPRAIWTNEVIRSMRPVETTCRACSI